MCCADVKSSGGCDGFGGDREEEREWVEDGDGEVNEGEIGGRRYAEKKGEGRVATSSIKKVKLDCKSTDKKEEEGFEEEVKQEKKVREKEDV